MSYAPATRANGRARKHVTHQSAMPPLKISVIAEAVSEHTRISVEALTSRRQRTRVSRARQMAMSLARLVTGRSLPEIGRYFGRHHTTVLHATQMVPLRVRNGPAGDMIGYENLQLMLVVYQAQREAAIGERWAV